MIEIKITDGIVVDAFNRLVAVGEDPTGMLMGIGEVVTDFTKRRFVLSQDPYGNLWEPNAEATLQYLLHSRKGSFTKKGKVSAKGTRLLIGKKPLIGESKSLSTQIHSAVIGNDTVTVTSAMRYAAMQHFGGSKAEFPYLWGDIPARPIFPDPAIGLPSELSDDIIGVVRAALSSALNG